MELQKSNGGTAGGESPWAVQNFMKSGDRQLFSVEIIPDETTYVSWKKLIKDNNKFNGSASVPTPPPNANPNLESRLAPTHPSATGAHDQPGTNRFSAVIGKIERLYMGKDSSDEEELDNTPDDDQYDTDDPFIDDEELDTYFEVDHSAIKHDGFFINRGKLERINKPPVLSNPQPKKRRRKDLAKANGEIDNGHIANKHVNVAKMVTGKTSPLLGKSSKPSESLALMTEHGDAKAQSQLNASSLSSQKKLIGAQLTQDPSILKVSNGNDSLSLNDAKSTKKLKTGVVQTKNVIGNKPKETNRPTNDLHQNHADKSAKSPSKLHPKPSNKADEFEALVRTKENNSMHDSPGGSDGKYFLQETKSSNMHKKDGSHLKSKISLLERSIRELEKLVADSRPPAAMENQETDPSAQAVKRRIPGDIKTKLAKVARIAQSTQGNVSMELINRLMSFLGHLMNLRTLKRNLKAMITMGLSAKQEKDERFQQIKKEVVEMIMALPPSVESNDPEHQADASNNFEAVGSEQKTPLKKKFTMDMAVEEKICDLYDLFVEGLDEDAGPQVRKLYLELAGLWPNGSMDNYGIKRAICRAKERRRVLYNKQKDQENMKSKKLVTTKLEETVRPEASSSVPQERLATDACGEKSIPKTINADVPSTNGATKKKVKSEKLTGNSSSKKSENDTKITDLVPTKKKVKRRPESETEDSNSRPKKLSPLPGDETIKSLKDAAVLAQQSNLTSIAAPSFDQSG